MRVQYRALWWVLLAVSFLAIQGCGTQLETRRSVRTTSDPADFREKDTTVMISPVDEPAPLVVDPDGLLKYLDRDLHRYVSRIQREEDDRFLIVFRGGEAVSVPTFENLTGIKLLKVETSSSSLLLQVRERTTLRVSLHEGKAHRGRVVKIKPLNGRRPKSAKR